MVVLVCCTMMMAQTPMADYQVIPMPRQVTRIQCDVPFVLDASVTVTAPEDPVMQRNAQFLCDYVEQSTGITNVQPSVILPAGIYSISGTRQNEMRRGLNIIVSSDGSVKKVYVK